MKALSGIGLLFSAFLIFLGISSRQTAGVLSYAVIFIGAAILVFVILVWTLSIIKKKREKADWDDFDNPE